LILYSLLIFLSLSAFDDDGVLLVTVLESLRSGVLDEDGNFVHIYETTRQDLNNDNNIISDPVTDDEVTLKPVYTIPNNSVIGDRVADDVIIIV
jgi:hypothetical protein